VCLVDDVSALSEARKLKRRLDESWCARSIKPVRRKPVVRRRRAYGNWMWVEEEPG